MTTISRRAALAFASALLLVSPAALAAPDVDSAEAAFERYKAEINTHDFDRLADDVIADDAVFVFSDATHRGIDAARGAFNRTWSIIPDEVYTMEQAEWLARDANTAVVAFRYGYKGTMKDGKPLAGGGHGTNVYKRTAKGWRLAYEHLSHDTKPTS